MTDRVYELLKTRVITLELGPGTRLNADRLAAELDVSPTPVREALNRLSAEGMVTVAPYRGFRVSELLSHQDLVLLLQARLVIEQAAVAQAAAVRDKATMEHLTALVARMDELSSAEPLDVKAFNAADASFHRLTVAASGNRFLLQAFDSLHVHVQIARHYQGRSVAEGRRANEEHARLLAALSSGDGEAASREAGAHIDGVLSRLEVILAARAGADGSASGGARAGGPTSEGAAV
ncbi:MAG: GntR family transcriptional regulator [Micromonosporaceae bacterium]